MYNILVEKETNLIKDFGRDYLLFNNVILVSSGGDVTNVIADCSSATCNCYQIAEPIEDFTGDKYIYQDGEVILNPDFGG